MTSGIRIYIVGYSLSESFAHLTTSHNLRSCLQAIIRRPVHSTISSHLLMDPGRTTISMPTVLQENTVVTGQKSRMSSKSRTSVGRRTSTNSTMPDSSLEGRVRSTLASWTIKRSKQSTTLSVSSLLRRSLGRAALLSLTTVNFSFCLSAMVLLTL